jgi:hypothetical protein
MVSVDIIVLGLCPDLRRLRNPVAPATSHSPRTGMPDRTLLSQCGEALYGARWQTALADALHVNDRTVRAWLTGRQQPRPAVWDAVWDLLYARWGEIEAAMVALNERDTV